MARYTDVIMVPLEPAMGDELRRRAQADHRALAAYVRLILTAALRGQADARP